MISYWKTFRNLSSLLRNLTYLSLLNSIFVLSRFSATLKSLNNYFFRWFAYKSLLSRFSVLISYNMWSSNHFSMSSCFACFSGSRFFRVQVFPGPGFRSSHEIRLEQQGTRFFRRMIFVQKQEIWALQTPILEPSRFKKSGSVELKIILFVKHGLR